VRWLFEQLFQLSTPLLLLLLKFMQLLVTALLQLVLERFSPAQLWLLLLQLLPLLLLMLFVFLLPPLLDGVEPDEPRRPFRDRRGLDLFIRGAGILREQIATGPVADGDWVSHSPKLGRLGGSLLILETRRLDRPW